MSSFAIDPLRIVVVVMSHLLGITLYFGLPDIWPYLFTPTRIAIALLCMAFGLYIWRDGLEGSARTTIGLLSLLTVLTASGLALWDIVDLSRVLLSTISSWKKAGQSSFVAVKASLRILNEIDVSPANSSRFW
ncbi:hypothetical protein [Paenochrobactrum glaciei]|uniref:Uncharacterized protein n=1 Tax=Paenochrobactrum glaciei TaxID=486407 RepID=A0ABN1GQ62_9HYPH